MIATSQLNISEIRKQFPILDQEVNGNQLVYLDNAATTQKPARVLDALKNYYEHNNANIHRGIHALAERATEAYEDTRKAVASFINAPSHEQVIFTKGTTEGINLVAQAYGRKFLQPGDEIIISGMEHHSNIVPWQIVCEQTGALLKVAPILDNGDLDVDEYEQLLSAKTKIVSMVYISNSLGTINPVAHVIQKAHDVGAVVLVDGAQAAPHLSIDVQQLDCDFMSCSAHKMYGPTGVGFLYGKRELLESMDPYQAGGEMISDVTFEKTSYNNIPYKFEAGTPNIGDVIATHEAIRFVEELGHAQIERHEKQLLDHVTGKLSEIDGWSPVGTSEHKASVISFNIEGIHPFDLGVFLDAKGIAVRTGHHCTQPVMNRFKIEGTARASLAVYNSIEEMDIFVDGLKKVVEKFRK
ncbi:MAG: cysteine desulfurase [Cyclobacteriaceae bacterium]